MSELFTLWASFFQFIIWTFSIGPFEPQQIFTSIYKKNHRFFLKTKKVRDSFQKSLKFLRSKFFKLFFGKCLKLFSFSKKVDDFFIINRSKNSLRFECAYLEGPNNELERGRRLGRGGSLYQKVYSFKKYTRLYESVDRVGFHTCSCWILIIP